MTGQDEETDTGLLARGQIHEADNAAVGLPLPDGQLAEILVQRDQHATFLMGAGQDGVVAGVAFPIARPIRIMPGGDKSRHDQPVGDTSIEQNLHAGARASGSMRSCATTLRA